jgi:muconolactone delta-isomerase
LPDAKKVFTDYTGGAIRLCGQLGPRGGHVRLNDAPAGSRVFIAEGIENALSAIALRQMAGMPPAFVVAAGAIFNMGVADLPDTITEVTLAADNDSGQQARAQIEAAIATHQAKGRMVRVWRSDIEGEDLNDALQRAQAAEALLARQEGAA